MDKNDDLRQTADATRTDIENKGVPAGGQDDMAPEEPSNDWPASETTAPSTEEQDERDPPAV